MDNFRNMGQGINFPKNLHRLNPFLIFLITFFILYLFPEIKISSFSLANFFPILVFLILFIKKESREIFVEKKNILIFWLVFIILNLLSIAFSPYKSLAIMGAGRIISLSTLLWIFFYLFKNKENWDIFLNFLFYFAIFSSLLNIFLFIFPSIIFKYLSKLYLHSVIYPRLGFPFLYPNTYAFFLLAVLVILLFNNFDIKQKNIFYFFISIGLILSGSKGGLIFYVLFSILSFLYFKNKKEIKYIMPMTIIFSIIFLFLWVPINKNKILSKITLSLNKNVGQSEAIKETYSLTEYKKLSVENRIDIWEESIYYFFKNPLFGYGPLVNRYKLTKMLAHNIFLDFMIGYGILGLIFLITIIFLITKKILKVRKPVYIFLFSYFLVYSLIETLFFNGIIDMIFCGFLVKLINEKNID